MREVQLIITGRVQGIFFRDSTCKQATALGVRGFVRNLSDGSVEVVAQGEDTALDALIVYCHKGPAAARVDHGAKKEQKAKETFPDFRIY